MKFKVLLLTGIIACCSCSQPQVVPSPGLAAKTGSAKAAEETNTSIYRRASSNVVSISVTSTERRRNRFIPLKGEGSGLIISNQGHVLTNSHVVRNATSLNIQLADNSTHNARTVFDDRENELAIIKTDIGPDNITLLTLGDSASLQVGQKVFAIGNPFGLSGTFTDGIISSLDRELKNETGSLLKGLIQTDAAINPGNSGGPLLDKKGAVIGLNIAIFSNTGGNIGIGFAIPVNKIKEVIKKSGITELNL